MEYKIHETGAIEVKEIRDGKIWRCAIEAGDDGRADKILGEKANEAKAAAGKNRGGWDKVKSDRAARLAVER